MSLEYLMTVRLQTENHLECVSLKGGYTGSSESTLVKIPHCWTSHVAAHILPSFLKNGNDSKVMMTLNIKHYVPSKQCYSP